VIIKLLGHQVCLETKQLRGKRTNYFAIKKSHTQKEELFRAKKKKNIYPKNKKKKHDPSNFLSHSPAHTHKKTLQTLFLHF
jgi:cytochrome b involved in lipid metabolism